MPKTPPKPDRMPPADTLPEEVQALGRYLRKRAPYMFCLRVVCAPDKVRKAKRIEAGLKTDVYKVALIRAAEFISMLHFCGWQVYSEDINAPALARLFPLCDFSDDLGSDRDDEEPPGFYGGNAGLPFFIDWPRYAESPALTPWANYKGMRRI